MLFLQAEETTTAAVLSKNKKRLRDTGKFVTNKFRLTCLHTVMLASVQCNLLVVYVTSCFFLTIYRDILLTDRKTIQYKCQDQSIIHCGSCLENKISIYQFFL